MIAQVAELVDALDLGSSGETCGGSSPPLRTIPNQALTHAFLFESKGSPSHPPASSTILIYTSLFTVIFTAALGRSGKPEMAERVDRVARWGFPLFFVVSWAVSMVAPTERKR